jgi:hypothetical protein
VRLPLDLIGHDWPTRDGEITDQDHAARSATSTLHYLLHTWAPSPPGQHGRPSNSGWSCPECSRSQWKTVPPKSIRYARPNGRRNRRVSAPRGGEVAAEVSVVINWHTWVASHEGPSLNLDPPMNWRWLSVGMRKVPSELG